MADSNRWQASLNEHRTAWIIASCCIGIIFIASAWPGLFSFEPSPSLPESQRAKSSVAAKQQARFTTPKKAALPELKKQPLPASKTKQASAKPQAVDKPRTITIRPQAKKETAATGNYYLQIGAFEEKTLAQKLVNKMKEHGWNAIIVAKSGFHVVWVGPKNSRSSIENLQKSIERTLKIKGFIVQKKPS